MSTIDKPRTFIITFALLLLCSCTTAPHSSVISSKRDLPGEASINKDAGRGNPIFVTLRLASGEEFPFEVDTGAEYTLLDTSLEPKLGRRVGSNTSSFLLGPRLSGGLYVTPPLYLGNTPLRSVWMERLHTNVVMTADLQGLASKLRHPLMGILGMDCLRYYCIQIDFQSAKLRFLNPAKLNTAGLGKVFALTYDAGGCPRASHGALLASKGGHAMVDTGYYPGDGALDLRLLKQARRQESEQTRTAQFRDIGLTFFPGCVWGGRTYTNLLIGEGRNLIGLRFLARHLVTLDFCNDKMYLRPTTSGPPAGDWYLNFRQAQDSATTFLEHFLESGRLPGEKMSGNCDWQEGQNSGTYGRPGRRMAELRQQIFGR